MTRIAVFPGSFDPITNGHFDIIIRAIPLFDKIIVAIGNNSNKKYFFSIEKRLEFLKKTLKNYCKIEIAQFQELTIDFCIKNKANFILRGIRNNVDFELEKNTSYVNQIISNGKLDTIFLFSSYDKSHISSSIVREIMTHNGEYQKIVPNSVRI